MQPGDTEFPPVCGQCGAPIVRVRQGQGKRQVVTDTCECVQAPEKVSATIAVKRAVRNTSAKGSIAESEIVKLMQDIGFDGYKTAGSGAHGSRVSESSQDTDVVVRLRKNGTEVFRAKVESKFMANVPGLKSMRNLLSGSNWLRVRQNRETAFWFLPEDQFRHLLALAKQGLEQ